MVVFTEKLQIIFGEKKTPESRADELIKYCHFHLKDRDSYKKVENKKIYDYSELYRIFYYDCEPVKKSIYNPITQKNFDFAKTASYNWMNSFLSSLKQRRKVALRMGFFADDEMNYVFSADTVKKICRKHCLLKNFQKKI